VDKTKSAGETVEETAKDAGRKVGRVAGKAKVPLVAGGAALAGAAGGIAALNARQNHRHRGLGGVKSKDLKKAAKRAGDVGAQVGEIALEVRRARERTNGHGAHRSPIEVVLQGLTSRQPKD
jgi:GNAT superfamily N-acetyltransferase